MSLTWIYVLIGVWKTENLPQAGRCPLDGRYDLINEGTSS